MHFTIRHMERREHPDLGAARDLPEFSGSSMAGAR
jgi:hypothetical protein